MRALLKALRLVKQNREVAIDTMVKFSELNKELAERTYDGMIGTFTTNGVVDEETQKNDLDIVREVLNVTKGSAHRARLRFQLREEGRPGTDESRLAAVIIGGSNRSSRSTAALRSNRLARFESGFRR